MSADLKKRLRYKARVTGESIYREVDDALDQRDAEIERLRQVSRENVQTMVMERERCKRWGKPHKELDRAIEDTRTALTTDQPEERLDGPPIPESVWSTVDELNEATPNTATADQPAQHRATLSVQPDAYYGWNVLEDGRIVSGPHQDESAATAEMRRRKEASLSDQPAQAGERIYIASKTKHAAAWRDFRDKSGWPIISTWIDEAGPGETADFSDLWRRCIDEARTATGLILYGEDGEILKGALVETGAALSAGVPVAVVGPVEAMKSARHHRLVRQVASLHEARAFLRANQTSQAGERASGVSDPGLYFSEAMRAGAVGPVRTMEPESERDAEGPEPDVHEALSRISWVLWDADPDSIRIARDDPQMNADWRAIKSARNEALEEAARVVLEQCFKTSPTEKANAIRALKDRQP